MLITYKCDYFDFLRNLKVETFTTVHWFMSEMFFFNQKNLTIMYKIHEHKFYKILYSSI